MTTSSRHIIRRQVLEVASDKAETNTHQLQERVKVLYAQHFLPLIEKCCAALDEPNTHIRLGNIVIDLDVADFLNPQADWLEKALKKLENDLMEAFKSASNLRQTYRRDDAFPNGMPSFEAGSNIPQSGRKFAKLIPLSKTASQQPSNPLFELLQCFLSTGQLPWWADANDPFLLDNTVLKIIESKQKQALLTLLSWLNAPFYLERFIRNMADTTLVSFCKKIEIEWERGPSATPFNENLAKNTTQAQRLVFWEQIFKLVIDVVSRNEFAHDPPPPYISEKNANNTEKEGKQADIEGVIPIHPLNNTDDINSNHPPLSISEKRKPKPQNPSEKPPIQSKGDDHLYIQNAGLVLLVPYLPLFFKNLGWAAEKQFVEDEKAEMAVQMLQFLADGQAKAPEFLLTLPKILCGFAPDALYSPERLLNEDEKAEAESFIKAILENVPELGLKTSDALRGSFLLRKGVLEPTDNHWILHVEVETFDLVLHKVPWNFQIIKLPWMKKPIFVDWALPNF